MKSEETTNSVDWLKAFEKAFDTKRAEIQDGKVSIWDYSNSDHFASLWRALEDGRVKKASRVLVIWSKTLPDQSLQPINTSEHVSPIHWAACAAEEVEAGEPKIRVTILDLNTAAHRGQYLYELCRNLKRHRLRWLTVLQARDLFGQMSPDEVFKHDPAPSETRVLEQRLFPKIEPSKNTIKPSLLRGHIREKLTSPSSPDDRHAITNIIGPIVLLNRATIKNEFREGSDYYIEAGNQAEYQPRKREADSSDHRLALESVFRAVGLLQKPCTDTDDAAKLKREEQPDATQKLKQRLMAVESALPRGTTLRITLVDDQWHHGWYEWLKSILPESALFTVCPDPGFLVKNLDLNKGKHTDCRFHFDLNPPDIGQDGKIWDILFLDLRLFSGERDAEAKFYMKLIPFCRKYEVAESGSLLPVEGRMVDSAIPRIKNLAWPGFTTLELQQVEDWIAGGNGRSDATHTVCLSLLPRLLALTDMSLSIILFSSSNQRALVELFEPYSNVITGFQKPHFFSRNSGDGLQSTYEQLATMLQRALSWNDLRSKCREIRSLRSASFSQDSALTAQGPSSRELYVELFIDEDDKSNVARFAVGGVFAIFNSVKDADCFDDIAVENGLRYFRGDLFPPQVFAQNRYPLLKKDYGCNGRRELARSLDRFRKGGGTVDLGFLQVRRGNVKGHAELARDEHDSRFLWMLSSVIELFAAESLPAISEQRGITLNDVSVSVYVGTRVVNTTESGDYTFQSNVKVHHFEDGPKLRSLGEDSIHTMVTECLRRHGITHMRFVRTIGRTLPYEGALPDKIKCVIDRVHNKVMAFDPGNDCAISVALGKKCIGRVSSKIEDRGFGFVEVPGLGAHVFIHYKQCTSYVDLLTGIPVSLRVERQRKPDGTQGYNGYEVCACTEADYEEWKGANRDHLSEDFLERVTNKDPASLRPDYRALHYVADQVMRYGVEEYSLGDADKLRGQFDEDCDLSMTLALESSRCLDLSDLSGAVRSFSFARPALRSYERPLARTLIGSRIASALDSCTGDQIVLALQEASSIEPHDHANLLVIAVQHQQPKAYASPARSSPTGAVESKPEVLTHDLASTVLTFRVKRAVSLDFLQNKLQSCFGARLRGVRAKEIGDDPDYRDVSFYLPPEFSHQIDAVSKSLQAKGWKVQVSKPPTDSEASATCSG